MIATDWTNDEQKIAQSISIEEQNAPNGADAKVRRTREQNLTLGVFDTERRLCNALSTELESPFPNQRAMHAELHAAGEYRLLASYCRRIALPISLTSLRLVLAVFAGTRSARCLLGDLVFSAYLLERIPMCVSKAMSYRRSRVLCLLLAPLVLQGCNGTSTPSGFATSEFQVASSANRIPLRTHAPLRDYVLRPNDKLRVKVFNEPEITGEYQIDAGGFISIPLAGRISAAGHTARQVERMIIARLNDGVIRDPKANVEVIAYAPFYILGEVKQPGEIQYKPGLTILDAVAAAGGFTYRANEEKVYVRRSGSDVEEIHSLRVPVAVFPGDNIRVPERYF